MPIFTRGERAVLFVHVPKTGGTTIERMMVRAGWAMAMRSTPTADPTFFRFHRISPQHYHADLLRRLLRLGRFEAVFMLVRDPVARFRSEYAMRVKEPRLGGAEAVGSWLDRKLEEYAANPAVHDNHLRPQHDFLLPQAHVLRLEDGMERIVADLNDRLDLGLASDGPIPRHMSSGAAGRLASGDVEVDDAVRARLRQFYARDFTAFGYDS